MKKSAFTLVEILIVVVLFGLLSGIILQTYTTISQVSFRIHQEKEIAKEALLLSQVLENLAQTTTIDYNQYDWNNINEKNWIVDTLHLKDNDDVLLSLTTRGNCLPSTGIIPSASQDNTPPNAEQDSPCQLILTQDKKKITLLDWKNFKLSKFQFKIIPYIGNKKLKELYKDNQPLPDNLPLSGQPAFWLIGSLYSNFYNPDKRSNNIALPLQLFFSLQGKTESLYSPSES